MPINVATNLASLNGQRNLAGSALTLNKSLQRLSSGLRINSAADDAAGLTISTGLTAQMRGLNQGVRNANDGISLLGTADGAISQQSDILQRLRELAVQAFSDTNSSANREAIDKEASQLKGELERIGRTTQFNGLNLLDGTFQGKDVQVGANTTGDGRVPVSIGSTKAADLGAVTTTSSVPTNYTLTPAGNVDSTNPLQPGSLCIVVDGIWYPVSPSVNDNISPFDSNISALSKANAINDQTYLTGVTAVASTTYTVPMPQSSGNVGWGDLIIEGVNIGGLAGPGGIDLSGPSDTAIVDAINNNPVGVTASLDSGNHIVLNAPDGRTISIYSTTGAVTGIADTMGSTSRFTGSVTLSSTHAFSVGGGNINYIGCSVPNQAAVGNGGATTTDTVATMDLTSKAGAQLAIQIADAALGQLNDQRSHLGALTNRLGTVIATESAASEQDAASNSRIQDADFAVETATMSRAQILQQAGVAILMQASQVPQLAMSLLR